MFMRLFRTIKHIGQRGDTIVEVLISVAIISLVLASAYATTNRNSGAIQNSQEREEAQRLVQSQIEMLRGVGSLTHNGWCFANGTEVTAVSACSGIHTAYSGADYAVSVTCAGVPNCTPTSVYTVKATWTSIGSNTAGDSNVTMFYRLN
jgi:type II secretory pathway pseudopilin PulG